MRALRAATLAAEQDFSCVEDETLKEMTLRDFAAAMFEACPALQPFKVPYCRSLHLRKCTCALKALEPAGVIIDQCLDFAHQSLKLEAPLLCVSCVSGCHATHWPVAAPCCASVETPKH